MRASTRACALLSLLVVGSSGAAWGQSPFQVRDVNPGPGNGVGSFHLRGFGLAHGARFYFAGTDGTGDRELWTSDGTEAGTSRVADLNPIASSSPSVFMALDATRILFRAQHETDGIELWVSDGTPGGTAYVRDINPGSGGSFAGFGAAQGGEVFFRATGVDGSELWKSDGTSAGTVQVADIRPGPSGSTPFDFVVAGGKVFFAANDSTANQELWTTDGTAIGTHPVIELNPTGSGSVGELAEWNGEVFFRGSDGITGTELWKSDGTNTVRIADINPGAGNADVSSLYAYGDFLYFIANDGTHGREIWRTNGTPGNATRVTDVQPGSGDGVFPSQLCGVNGVLVFAGQDGANGRELWATDGTTDGEFLLAEVQAGPPSGVEFQSLRCVADVVMFQADDGINGEEPWLSDGTIAGTMQLGNIAPGAPSAVAFAPGFTELDGLVFFPANEGLDGYELWAVVPNAGAVPSLSHVGLGFLAAALAFVGSARLLRRSAGTLAVVAVFATGAHDASATILTFDQGNVRNRDRVDESYGDHVEALVEGSFSYGVGDEGFTPDVTVRYGTAQPNLWTTGYGDLQNVLYEDLDESNFLEITLNASVGHAVALHGFELAAFAAVFPVDPTIDRVTVRHGGAVLFEAHDIVVSRLTRSAFDFSLEPLVGATLAIQIDARNLQGLSDDIAIDNLRFGQTIPEPATALLVALGLLGLGIGRVR